MPKSSKRSKTKRHTALVFEPRNYVLLLAAVSLIVVGFVLMYLEGEFLGFISLTVSPILILGGYAGIIYALLWRPAAPEPEDE